LALERLGLLDHGTAEFLVQSRQKCRDSLCRSDSGSSDILKLLLRESELLLEDLVDRKSSFGKLHEFFGGDFAFRLDLPEGEYHAVEVVLSSAER